MTSTLNPRNSEFLVNTYTDDEQSNPGIGANPASGGFQVVWQSDGQDGSFWGVFGQNFSANGNKEGGEISIADMTLGDQENPDVAFNEDGNGMWVWQTTAIYNSAASNPDEPSVTTTFPAANYRTSSKTFGFEAEDGSDELYYNFERLRDGGWDDDPIGKDAIEPTVISIGGDMFINGWYRKDEDRIEYRYSLDQISADFDKVTSANGDYSRGFAEAETVGRTYTNFGDVALLRTVEDRRFGDLREMIVVTTLASDLDAADGVIQFQIFQESPVSGLAFKYGSNLPTDYNDRFVLGESGQTGDASRPRVAILEDGGFAITWQERNESANNEDNWHSDIYVQVFNDDLTARTGAIGVDTKSGSDQTLPEIEALKDGGFAITWTDSGGNGDDVRLQRFNEDGWKIGFTETANETKNGDQGDSVIAELNNGDLALAWESSNGDDDSGGVMARIFEVARQKNKDAQVIEATDANEKISTGGKADYVDGGGGNDNLNGGKGNDTVIGGDGDDMVKGAGGKDRLDGGLGDDMLEGGGGKDKFIFNGGIDQIKDYADGEKVLFDRDLATSGRLTKKKVKKLGEETDDGVVFDFGTDELTLLGVNKVNDVDIGFV